MLRIPHHLLLIAIGYLLFTNPTCAQNIAGVFPTLDATWQLGEKQSISTYQFYALPLRSLDGENENLPQWLLYYGEYSANRNLGKRLSFSGAYVFQLEHLGSQNVVKENRAHFQLKYTTTMGKASIVGRMRSDNRFIQLPETTAANYAHRLRFLGGISVPMNKWTLMAYEELFFNTPSIAEWRYAENWAAIQFKRQIASHLHLETGPLFITWKTGADEWFNQYYWQTTLSIGL